MLLIVLAVAAGVLVVAAVIGAVVIGSRHNTKKVATATSVALPTSVPTTPAPSTTAATGSTRTAPADQQRADEDKITQLFSGVNSAWAAGRDQGIAFTVAHTYPGLAQTVPACQVDIPAGETQSYQLDTKTFAPAPSFQAMDGDDVVVPVDGRIYQVMATVTITDPGKPPDVSTSAVHAVVAPDGNAYMFFLC